MHMVDKIVRIRSQLETKHGAGPLEMPRECTYPVIWEYFDTVGPEEVDRVLGTMSAAICELDPYSSWLVKAIQEVACEWILAMVSSPLREGMVLVPFN